MKKIFLIVSLFSILYTKAQIINVESLRMVTDTTGWAGSIHLNVSFAKNVKELFKVSNKVHVQYKTPKHLFLFMNSIGFDRADDADFVNKGVQHLRYNFRFHSKWTWEAFLQNQYNAVSKIEYRRLAGSGLRWKMTDSEKYKIYLGSLIMYENEKTKETSVHKYYDWRNSTYLSFSFYFNDKTSLVSTTYFQPKFGNASDVRIAHESRFSIKIFKNLAYNTSFEYTYDALPVAGIPKRDYELKNGLAYTFN